MSPRPKSPVLYLVDSASGCWMWQRALNSAGYGVLRVDGRLTLAHRHFHEQEHGPIPPGLTLDHAVCQTPACVNPGHTEAVTHAENVRRGRAAKLTREQATEIRRRAAGGESIRRLGAAFGVGKETARAIVAGLAWT